MALDISRVAALSSVGLLADKVRVELDRVRKTETTAGINTGVFERASVYLSDAIAGLEQLESLEVDEQTVYAIDAYETVLKASARPRPEDVTRMTQFILELREVCDRLAKKEEVEADSISLLENFFSSLSKYATHQRYLILQESSAVAAPNTAGYAY